MNRLIVGDVGSGKTVVAGIACYHVLQNGFHAALVAPTQILAEQHFESLKKLFPTLNLFLITSSTNKKNNTLELENKPTLYVGTHAVINRLNKINPALIIYDEQHRFGVEQRSGYLKKQPHTLTMTATPIPRSYMLTLFSHLDISIIDEMPPGRIPTKTWLITKNKRQAALDWIYETLNKKIRNNQMAIALFVCPFIKPSKINTFSQVSSAINTYKEINNYLNNKQTNQKTKLKTGLLHSQLNKKDKKTITNKLFNNQINILVTTPIIEVGLDLPSANIIIIESAERFGLASLHQLRGRVGRSGQESSCLLFTSETKHLTKKRLNIFTKINDGIKLAEFDLKNRGAGDIFGVSQHGLDILKYSNWADLKLIAKAKDIFNEIQNNNIIWHSYFPINKDNQHIASN